MAEDPVTGSLNAALAQWLIGDGLAPSVTSRRRVRRSGAPGRVHVEREAPSDLDRRRQRGLQGSVAL